AYETQAAEIAASKAEGLRRHYGLDERATKFWGVHAGLEATHARWSVDALALVSDDADAVSAAVREGADAWWAFLDEREAQAA
ncbi:MAG: iron-containing redox enzyme family protein, partial [Acidimicrobiales bacterium]